LAGDAGTHIEPLQGYYSEVMFPLCCELVRTHTGRDTSAHKKTWSTHICDPGQMLHKSNFMHAQTLKKIEGKLRRGAPNPSMTK